MHLSDQTAPMRMLIWSYYDRPCMTYGLCSYNVTHMGTLIYLPVFNYAKLVSIDSLNRSIMFMCMFVFLRKQLNVAYNPEWVLKTNLKRV